MKRFTERFKLLSFILNYSETIVLSEIISQRIVLLLMLLLSTAEFK